MKIEYYEWFEFFQSSFFKQKIANYTIADAYGEVIEENLQIAISLCKDGVPMVFIKNSRDDGYKNVGTLDEYLVSDNVFKDKYISIDLGFPHNEWSDTYGIRILRSNET